MDVTSVGNKFAAGIVAICADLGLLFEVGGAWMLGRRGIAALQSGTGRY